jgi:MoaA/NifB/PqqE/SkfB family radical SAM enzyme
MDLKDHTDPSLDGTLDTILSDISRTLSSSSEKEKPPAREMPVTMDQLPSLPRLISALPGHHPLRVILKMDSDKRSAEKLMMAHRACREAGILKDRKVTWQGPPELLRYLSAAEGRILTGPRMVQINIANRCNLDCIFCWVHTPFSPPLPEAWQKTRIPPPLFEKTVSGLGRIGTGGVIFSGQGEPFIHPQIYDMIAQVKAEGIKLVIQTNLHLADIEKVSDLGVDALHVNLSAASEATYQKVHPAQKNGAFARLKEKMGRIRRLRVGGRQAPELELIHVIHSKNYHELPDMVALADEVGARAVSLKMMETNDHVLHLLPSKEMQDDLEARLDKARRLASRLDVNVDFSGFDYQLSHVRESGEFSGELYETIGCYMGWFFVRVNLDGKVSFCCKDKFFDRVTPSRTLTDVWQSVKYHNCRLIARDMDFRRGRGFLDAKCRRCSNFNQNMAVHTVLH